MGNKTIIIILITILSLIVIAIVSMFLFNKCPEDNVTIKELSPKNGEAQTETTSPKIYFNGKVDEKNISFNIRPATEFNINFKQDGNNTIVTLTPIKGSLDYDTEYTIIIKPKSRCSQIKELTNGSFEWKFKTATRDELVARQDKADEELYKNNSLIKYLPHKNADFQVIFLEGSNIYQITLYAILNNPNQVESYKQQLKQYKQEALDWIKSKKVDPSTLKIKWLPEANPDNPKI